MAADTLDTPNFSVVDTMPNILGNTELLDIIDATSVTSDTDKIKNIDDEPKTKEKPKKDEKPKEKPVEKDKTIEKFFEGKEEEEETTEEPVEKEEEETEVEEGGEARNEVNSFNALSKDLFKLGVFTKEEGEADPEINTPEEFLTRFTQEKQKGAHQMVGNFIGQFGEDYQEAFEAIYVNGVNPKDYFGTYSNIIDFSSLDLKTETNQTAVIRQSLIDQGLEQEDISAEIEKLKNFGELETTAQRYHKALLKKEQSKLVQLEEESKQRVQQQSALKTQYVKNVQTVLQDKINKKEFDGIPVNPKLASELQDFLLVDKYKTPSGETLTDFDKSILDLKRPENHERKVKIALLLKILEKDPTLSTIQKAGVSKKTDALFGELARQTTKSSGKAVPSTKDKPTKWWI